MAIPDYETVMLPLLRLSANGPVSVRDATTTLGTELGLSPEEQVRMLPKANATVFRSRVGWAKTYLKQAGLVAQPARAVIEATQRGRDVLAGNPAKIDGKLLSQFAEFREFVERSRMGRSPNVTSEPAVSASDLPVPPTIAPEERIEQAHAELDADLRSSLLDRIVLASPDFFENLVLDLLGAMGYGGRRAGARERLGKSGDGGVDGLIREDELGLDRLYLQAKRYQRTNRVGVDTIRSFAGALDDHGADKGIMITTSSYSADAIAYTKRNQRKRIILIDGEVLADLMVRFGVGVRLQRTFEMKRIDQDYFDEVESD
jgi:restriction system protein